MKIKYSLSELTKPVKSSVPVLFFLLYVHFVHAASSTNSPVATATNASVGTVDWTASASIVASDDVYATASVGAGGSTYYITASDFGFTIPIGSTIDSIQVIIERKGSGGSAFVDESVRLIKGGIIQGDDNKYTIANWPTADGSRTYGTNSLWGLAWTAADINALDFGVAVAANNTGATTKTASIDHIQITVYYTSPPPVANFTFSPASPSPVCTNDTVFFTNTSTEAVSYKWNFGDFSPEDFSVNPVHVYTWDANFTVALTAYNSDGDSNIIQKDITVRAVLMLGSWSNPNPSCPGSEVEFTSWTWPSPTWVKWYFDDGDSSSFLNPVHTYLDTGFYMVKFIAGNSCGSDTSISTHTVNNDAAPFTSFGASPNPACTNAQVQFNNFSWPEPVANKWYFGDGDSSSAASPVHSYSSVSSYTVTLIAFSDCSSDTATNIIAIDSALIPVFFINASPNPACPGDEIAFSVSGDDMISFLWNFDDGNISLQQNPLHTYTDTGTYNVRLTVTNSCGISNTDTMLFVVSDTVPPALFGFWSSPTPSCPGSVVNFTTWFWNFVPVAYFWDFDDGAFSTLQNPSHSYAAAGSYNVKFVVTNSCGIKDSVTNIITVDSTATPFAWFWYNPSGIVCPGSTINFQNFSSDTTGSFWNFGDTNTSTLVNPKHIYADTGTYTVTLTVTNACGNSASNISDVAVYENAGPPNVDATVFPSSVCPGEEVNFSFGWWNVDTANVVWLFGDGDSSNLVMPSHQYTVSGTYTATLIVRTPCGNDTDWVSVTVKPGASADFMFTTTCNLSAVNFTDLSVPTPDTWAWDLGDGDTSTAQNPSHTYSAVNIYNVTLSVSASGCTNSITKLAKVSNLSVSAFDEDALCGGDYGKAFVTASAGIVPYTYLWNDPASQTNDTASGLPAATYTVTVTDNNGCSATAATTITEPAALTVDTVSVSHVPCFGLSNGAIDASVAGGTASYTYSWSNGDNVQDADSISGGTYKLTVTDANGCMDSISVVVNEPAAVLATTLSSTPDTCNRGDGTATASSVGGTSPYIYVWNDPASQTTGSATGLMPGVYIVTVTDANGCDTVSSVTVVAYASGVAIDSLISENASACAAADGKIVSFVTGGKLPYTYLWDDPASQTNDTALGLSGGTVYNLLVTDALSCTDTDNEIVNSAGAHTVAIDSIKHVSCNSGTGGVARVAVTGGIPPYTYVWSGGSNPNDSITGGLASGTYNVTVVDSSPCQASTTVTITEPTAISNSISIIMPSCFAGSNGKAIVEATGGTPGYTYLWNDAGSQTNDTASGLPAATYVVTVTDANGCVKTDTAVVGQPSDITVGTTVTNVSCFAGSDGKAIALVTGGTPGYIYVWDDAGSQTNDTASGLPAATYVVTVTDNNGCSATGVATITEPAVLAVDTVSVSHVPCFGLSNGAIDVSIAGGTAPYTYSWSNGDNVQDADSISASTYKLTVTDANGCVDSISVVVNEPAAVLAIGLSSTPDTCNRGDGTATAVSVGGTSPYTYTWNDPASQTTGSATGLTPGAYTVTVADANGCDTVNSVTVVAYASGIAIDSLVSVNASSCAAADGKIVSFVTGGKLPYIYLWDDPASQTNDTALGLSGGNIYNLLVTDALSCTDTGNEIVNSAGAQTVAIDSTKDVSCKLGTDGVARVAATGGTPPYTYVWSGGANPNDSLTGGLAAGTYNVTVFDSAPCQALATVTITEPTAISNSISTIMPSCFSGSNGKAIAAATGGTPGYTYLWNDPASQTNDTASGLPAATYVVTVTDANGCTATGSATVAEPAAAVSVVVSADTCSVILSGKATATGSGGTGTLTYKWSDPASQTTAAATGLASGAYTVTVTDANNCTATASVTILLCVGIDKISASDFSATVYPNPNNGKFVISVTGAVKDDYVIEIRDIIGKVVYSNKFDNISGKLVNQFDVSLQNQGVYFVNIKSSTGINTQKLVIQH